MFPNEKNGVVLTEVPGARSLAFLSLTLVVSLVELKCFTY